MTERFVSIVKRRKPPPVCRLQFKKPLLWSVRQYDTAEMLAASDRKTGSHIIFHLRFRKQEDICVCFEWSFHRKDSKFSLSYRKWRYEVIFCLTAHFSNSAKRSTSRTHLRTLTFSALNWLTIINE